MNEVLVILFTVNYSMSNKFMKKRFGLRIILAVVLLIFCISIAACENDNSNWPKNGPASNVPKPQAGNITVSATKEDVDGKAFCIISIENFTADDLGNYIRLLVKKGFVSELGQRRNENYIMYTAKKGNKTVSLSFDENVNELRIEIE